MPEDLIALIEKERQTPELKRADGQPSDFEYVAIGILREFFAQPARKRRARQRREDGAPKNGKNGKGKHQRQEPLAVAAAAK